MRFKLTETLIQDDLIKKEVDELIGVDKVYDDLEE